MKKFLSTAVGVAFLSVTASAFAAETAPQTSQGQTTTSEQDLEKIHTSPAKKQSAPAKPQSGTGSSNYSDQDLEKIHTSPAKKGEKPPAKDTDKSEAPKTESK